jgi:hypothetical protein
MTSTHRIRITRGGLVKGRAGWEWDLISLQWGSVTAHGWVAGRRTEALIEAKAKAHELGLKASEMRAPRVGVKCNECGASGRVSGDTGSLECSECGGSDVEVIA